MSGASKLLGTSVVAALAVASMACRDRTAAPPSTTRPITPAISDAPVAGGDAGPVVAAPVPTLPADTLSARPERRPEGPESKGPPLDASSLSARPERRPEGPESKGPALAVVDAPIKWPPSRDAAMLAYRRAHSDPTATDTRITPRMIVLHYTAGGSAAGTRRYFDNLSMESGRAALRAGGDVNVSAHFLVDRDGTIYKLMPEDRMARHAIGVNHHSIGVENVGDEKRWPLTDAQVTANAALIRDLASRWPIELVVGHHEVRALEGTPWFVELDPRYRNRKGDPGPRFMAKVRAATADLGLAPPPPPARPPPPRSP